MWGGDGVVFPQALRAAPEAAREGSAPNNGQYHNEHGHLVHAVKAWLHQLVGGLQPAAQLPPPAPLVEPWAAVPHAPLHHRNAGQPAQAQQQGPRGHPAERSQPAAGAAGQPATPPVAAASHAAPPAPSGGNGARRSKPRLFQRGTCQADGCTIDLTAHSYYSNRNHICPSHLKADSFVKLGEVVRFCQRCGISHPLIAFDGKKHSCREQLERHNNRRRNKRAHPELPAEPAAQTGPEPGPLNPNA